MPNRSELTKNQQRARRLLEALLKHSVSNSELKRQFKNLRVTERKNVSELFVVGTLQLLADLTEAYTFGEKLDTKKIQEAIATLEKLLPDFKRETQQGSSRWELTIPLGHRDTEQNLEQFDAECQSRNTKTHKGSGVTPKPTPYENLGRRGVDRDRFIGRDEKLKELHDLLQENAQVAITAAVIGMGGVGKTELAIQYARENLTTYQGGVCWLPASDFALKLVEFARPRFFPNISFDGYSLAEQVAYCWQHWAEGDVLLVLDDVTNYKQQVQPYLPESSRFKVLVTTRERLGKPIVLLDLEVLAPAEALDLLKSLLSNERVERELDIAAELCDLLGYLPLGLELVGRYLEEEPLSITQMLERLKRKRLRHPSLVQADPMMTAQLGVSDAFELSWERLDENAQQLGCLLSLFALAPIPWELVEGVYKCWRDDAFEPEDLQKPRRNLIKLHLLKTEKKTYSLHQLIRQFFQTKLDESSEAEEAKTAFATILVKVAKQLPNPRTHEDILNLTPFIPHLAEVATHLSQFLNDEDLITPFTRLGAFYASQGFDRQAEPWYKLCVEVAEHRLGSDHPDVATSLNNLALLYKSQRRYSEAEPLYLQALEIDRRTLPADHPHLAIYLNNLALLYKSQGRYSDAEPLYLQALEIDRRTLPADHPQLATHLNNLALLYKSQGRYSEAEPLFLQALEINRRTLAAHDPGIAIHLGNLAELYRLQGRYSEAEPLFLQALEIDRHTLLDDHPQLAIHLNNLAELYRLQGRYSEAEPLFLEALEICERRLGVGHPDTITVRANYAMLLRQSISSNSTELEALQFPPSVQAILDEIQAIGELQDATPESGD